MAVKLVDLADQLGVKVADLRDYIDFLDLDIPKNALETSEAKAKELEKAVKEDREGEEGSQRAEGEDDSPAKGGQRLGGQEVKISEESKGKIETFEEDLEAKLQREIKDEQRKKTAGKKETKKKRGTKEVKKQQVQQATDTGVEEAVQRKATGIVEIPDIVSVNEFAQRAGIPVARVIGELMKNGILATINQQIDFDTASIIAQNFQVKINKKREEVSLEEFMGGDLANLLKNEEKENLEERPPVVVVMGHVDHGKTTILDKIRSADVAAGESGGITQHIGAYQVTHKGKRITFLDTPGHESFSAMRARGARVTDIAILVVAADEGIKPQTEEAYSHAKAAGVPVIVAMNKIDKEGADLNRVKNELAQKLGLSLEEWGGDVPVVPLSAVTGEGIESLLDHIIVISEVAQYKANPNREAIGTVIESHLDKNLGPIATVIVNTGTLQIMDNVVIGAAFGRIKRMMDHKGKTLKAVGPSGPVQVAGLSEVPSVGDLMIVVKDEKTARDRAFKILAKRKDFTRMSSLVDIMNLIKQGKVKVLNVIVKADTKGSLEAILSSLSKVGSEEVKTQVIFGGIGNVTMNDVNMAITSTAVIFAFHVATPPDVSKLADQLGAEIRPITIIYQLLDEVKMILEGLLDPEVLEVEVGEAKVLQIFLSKKKEMIVGCKVQKGKMQNKLKVRILRKEALVGEGDILSLQKGQERVNEVADGYECGIRFSGNIPLEPEDVVQAYRMEKRKRTL